jgi:hypothetical protein
MEPNGNLLLDNNVLDDVALSNATKMQMSAFHAMLSSKPMSSSEVALHLLGIPTIFRDFNVDFIKTPLPSERLVYKTRDSDYSRGPSIPHMTLYQGRPSHASCENLSFYDYFRKFKVTKELRPTYACIGKDMDDNFVYVLPDNKLRLVRFSDHHPGSSPEVSSTTFFSRLLHSELIKASSLRQICSNHTWRNASIGRY